MYGGFTRKLCALVVATATAGLITATAEPTAAQPRRASQPNVVLITVDDMRADDLVHMPRTKRLLGQLELTEFVSNHPICCPARASLLTGQFGHHNGVHHNGAGTWGGYGVLQDRDNTVARWFAESGYVTSMIGKFVNGWKPDRQGIPLGWTDFHALWKQPYSAYDFKYYDDGRARAAVGRQHTNDFVTTQTLGRIRAYTSARRPKPFLIWSSYVAPHGMTDSKGRWRPPIPAARHVGTMAGAVPPSVSKPSYQPPSDAQQARALYEDAGYAPSRTQVARASEVSVHRHHELRLESLQSVDEGVAKIVKNLRKLGVLADSILVFTSDNGYLMGEHGLMGKNSYYEESLRVPLLARGPGVGVGQSAKGAMFPDIAPSLATLAGVPALREVDGRADLFSTDGGWEDVLIQAGSDTAPWLWRGVRTARWTYVEPTDGEPMLFDREADPYQLDDVAGDHPGLQSRLADSLATLTQ